MDLRRTRGVVTIAEGVCGLLWAFDDQVVGKIEVRAVGKPDMPLGVGWAEHVGLQHNLGAADAEEFKNVKHTPVGREDSGLRRSRDMIEFKGFVQAEHEGKIARPRVKLREGDPAIPQVLRHEKQDGGTNG